MSSRSVQIIGSEGDGEGKRRVLVDEWNNALVMQDEIHSQIHRGNLYTITQQANLGAGTETDILIRPSGGMHLRISAAVEHKMLVNLYEGTTWSAAGAPLTALNRNRFSGNTHDAQLNLAPTVTGTGVLISGIYVPGGTPDLPIGGSLKGFEEWILNPANDYLLRISNTIVTPAVAGRFGLSLNFYEPDPK